jgi:hypothetical protein
MFTTGNTEISCGKNSPDVKKVIYKFAVLRLQCHWYHLYLPTDAQ